MDAVACAENCYVYETDTCYLLFPQYRKIEFVFENRPSKSDSGITLVSSSAFCQNIELGFRHMNIVGDHAKDGVWYEGNDEKGLNAFIFYDGEAHFVRKDPDAAIKLTADNGGDGFEQFLSIYEGEFVICRNKDLRCYRLLAELNGRICIIDTKYPMAYDDFVHTAMSFGVENALFLDMGSKVNYSWYRKNNGDTQNLFPLPIPLAHSWIVFRK